MSIFTFSLRCCLNLCWDDDLFVVFWSLVLSTFDIFGRPTLYLAKYSHEIYFKSNYLGLLHVTGLSS